MTGHAQSLKTDTLKVISYNVNNYGFAASQSCPGLITANKHVYLRNIVQYTDPDILGLLKNGCQSVFLLVMILLLI